MVHFSIDSEGFITLGDEGSNLTFTDKAASYIRNHNIQYIYELEGFAPVGNCIFGLKEEASKKDFSSPDDIFGFRIKALSKIPAVIESTWNGLDEAMAELEKIYGRPEYIEARRLDAYTALFLQNTKPVWRIHYVRPEAAALIRHASISDEDLQMYAEEARKGIYIKAESGVLTGACNEIFVIGSFLFMGIQKCGISIFLKLDDAKDEDLGFPAKLLALQHCSNSPIVVRDPDIEKAAKHGMKITSGVTRRNISLSDRYYSMKRQPGKKAIDKSGKTLTVVQVSGFIRNQPYGKGRAERKTIWIDGFTRGQWVNTGLSYVTVKA